MPKKEEWKMPAWMEPYRGFINNTGGNPVEELENDTSTNIFVNAPRAMLCCCIHAQIQLLYSLHEAGKL